MSTVDPETMQRLFELAYASAVSRAHGAVGVARVKELLSVLRRLYRRVDPDGFQGPFRVAIPLQAPKSLPDDPVTSVEDLSALVRPPVAIEVVGRNTFVVRHGLAEAPDDWDTSRHLIYQLIGRRETLLLPGEEIEFENPVAQFASSLAIPRFKSLDDALARYAASSIRLSRCYIFQTCWNEPARWMFKNRPESTMRKSLEQFLSNTLCDADVRPEQNVDETHPVDLRVLWHFSNSVALIEIKWMGASVSATRTILTTSKKQRRRPRRDVGLTVYDERRANDGAKQLVGYLDSNEVRSSGQETRGILVVVDGRRQNVVLGMTELSVADAVYFRDNEIVFQPDFSSTRDDFAARRMFAEPLP